MDLRPLIALVTAIALTSALYLARDFLMPLALAVLIVFLLTPLVARLQGWGLSRVPAVVVAAISGFAAIGLAVYLITGQIIDLANSLPRYKDNLRAKAAAFHTKDTGPIGRVSETFHDVAEEFAKNSAPTPAATAEKGAVPVELVNGNSTLLSVLRELAGPLLQPLGTTAIVIVFVIFMLLEREDLRDRFIHVVGRGRLRVTTQALDDAGHRVSRYLAAQLLVNATYGIPIGVGLYAIGVPNAPLWGALAIVLRFLPYIGPWIAASFPLMLSVAVSPGWWPLAETVALFVVVELISNNVVEPWLYGASTGLSPIAIIVSAAFWTWLWGAGGLLLATPLTVCLAVLGKHVPALGFLDVLLGDSPPIAPEDRFYQRLLAGDESELLEIVESYSSKDRLPELYDSVIIPALKRAEEDFTRGAISREERHEIAQLVCETVTSLEDFPDVSEGPEHENEMILVPARSEAEELAARMLAHLLHLRGVPSAVTSSRMLSSELAQRLQEKTWTALCISVLSPGSMRHAEALLRRFGACEPSRALVGRWARSDQPDIAGPSFTAVGSLAEAARHLDELSQLDATPAPVEAAAGRVATAAV